MDLNAFGQAPAPVGHPGVWSESSGLAEVEGDGPPEVLAGSGPNLAPEANWASDDALYSRASDLPTVRYPVLASLLHHSRCPFHSPRTLSHTQVK